MTRHQLFTVDVFTSDRFLGNPLGVVIHRQGINDEQMQAVAREINYSETTFLPENAIEAVRSGTAERLPMRIFTPTRELPFAGHPVVGTSWVLSERLGLPTPLHIDIPAGALVVAREDGGFAFDTPVPELQDTLVAAYIAAVAGISPADLEPSLSPRLVSGGPAFLLVPLASADTLENLHPNLEQLRRYAQKTKTVSALYAFAVSPKENAESSGPLRVDARMFFDANGVREDPATGSAAAALGAYLRAHWNARLPFTLAINQGVAMGRASLLRMTVSANSLRLAGNAVPVIEGSISI